MNQDVKFKVIELLKGRGAYSHSVNGKQHYTRCPYCGDSKNLSHAHMSIMIDVESDSPMLFRCFKCDMKGMVTEETLNDLDLYIDNDMKSSLKSFNKKAMKLSKIVNTDMEKFSVPVYTNNYQNSSKLNYINERLGTNIDFTEAKDLKLVLNVFDFMKFNEITEIEGMRYSMLKLLHNDYIGFLSCNNNCIVFRDITGKNKYRYFKVTLNTKNVNQDNFYALPNKINLLYTNDINIHISEGTFDIISIYKNLINTKENNFFYANCGFGSTSIIKYLLHHGINTGLNIHIYSDNDKTDYDHKKYLQHNPIIKWVDNIYIHRNAFPGEKDYGIPKGRIYDTKRMLI